MLPKRSQMIRSVLRARLSRRAFVRTRGSRAGSAPKSWASTSLGTLGRVALTACSHHRHRKDPSLAATTFSTSASQAIPSCSPLLACRSCPTPARLPPCELSLPRAHLVEARDGPAGRLLRPAGPPRASLHGRSRPVVVPRGTASDY